MNKTTSPSSSGQGSLQGNEVPPRQAPPLSNVAPGVNPGQKSLERKNGIVAGVASGFADYFDVDVTVLRLLLVVLTLVAGPAIPVAYLVAWLVMPREGQPASSGGNPSTVG